MATKKQKREAALAKHERYMEAVQQDGLRAQREDHERRQRIDALLKAEAEAENRRLENILAAARLRGELK